MAGESSLQGAQGAQGAAGWIPHFGFPIAASPAATLTPGADPAVSFALTSSREELVPRRVAQVWKPPRKHGDAVDGLPVVDDLTRFDAWADDIRVENCVTELMQPLRLTVSSDGLFRVRHELRADAADDKASFTMQRYPIMELTRPPAKLFEAQTQQVFDLSDLRNERMAEIVAQIGIPMQFWASIVDLNANDKKRTLELLSIALLGLSHVNQFAKHTFGCPRPTAYSPSIQPMINPRRFGAFPCGHGAEAFLVARLLQELSGQKPYVLGDHDEPVRDDNQRLLDGSLRRQLQGLAKRISDNRVVAGVHFQIDNVAGRLVGETFAEYLLYRCGAENGWQARKFAGAKTMDGGKPLPNLLKDFDHREAMDKRLDGTPPLSPYFDALDYQKPAQYDFYIDQPLDKAAGRQTLLQRAWQRAVTEWADWRAA